MKTFRELAEAVVNELIYGNKPKKKDKQGNPVYADFVENGIRIKWSTTFGDHKVMWHADTEDMEDPQVFGQELYSLDNYAGAAAKYEEILKLARKNASKVKFPGTISHLGKK